MNHYTPLRYPGGKRRLAPAVIRLLEKNDIVDFEYVEPYAGGAGVALGLLFEEYASSIHLNDFCRAVYAIWHTVLNDNEWLCKKLSRCRIDMKEWAKHRNVYDNRESANLADLGFSALYLNRTNRSGIMTAGVIGGKKQSGKWKLDARFNKDELISRIQRVGRFRDRIHIYQMDGCDFNDTVVNNLPENRFVFYDPPYIERSRLLYQNLLTWEDHQRIEGSIERSAHPWIVTYDYGAVSRRMYGQHRRLVYNISYTSHKKHNGQEVMYFSDDLVIPDVSTFLGQRIKPINKESRVAGRE